LQPSLRTIPESIRHDGMVKPATRQRRERLQQWNLSTKGEAEPRRSRRSEAGPSCRETFRLRNRRSRRKHRAGVSGRGN
jgi:hypothetical protein